MDTFEVWQVTHTFLLNLLLKQYLSLQGSALELTVTSQNIAEKLFFDKALKTALFITTCKMEYFINNNNIIIYT